MFNSGSSIYLSANGVSLYWLMYKARYCNFIYCCRLSADGRLFSRLRGCYVQPPRWSLCSIAVKRIL